MGLDISVYTKIQKITDLKKIENGDYFAHVTISNDEYDSSFDIEEGYYDGIGVRHHFRAGSYSGYNLFRNTLSKSILGVPDETVWEKSEEYKGKPMYEIISFSDCEGCMGPAVCKKLHNDFVENREKFVQYLKSVGGGSVDHYCSIYDDFTKGFRMVSNEGILIFH